MNWMNSTYEFIFVMQSIVRTRLFMLPIMVYEQLLRGFLILTYEFKKYNGREETQRKHILIEMADQDYPDRDSRTR